MFYSCSCSYARTFIMKLKKIYLTITVGVLSLIAYNVSSQIGPPEYKDTSQTITKEELFKEREKLEAEKKAKKQNKADAKLTQKRQRNAIEASRESDKAYRDENESENVRNNSKN